MFATGNDQFEWRLYLNPVFAGDNNTAIWIPLNNSALEYDVSRTVSNTVTDGILLGGGYGSNSNPVRVSLQFFSRVFLTLGSTIDGVSDQFVLAVAAVSNTDVDALAAITMAEFG